ncbi:uncharacterized protein LOC111029461 [Myzus persicae]|uniref:uncharacterized protein LOC111029461 n=1 Tax=Myzus persicae TaxID=13164 RepID=UPI000B93963D|nr:uncharacterized protein LOC111029461 [Myzus persicae]
METNEQVKSFTPEDEDGNSWRGMGFGSKVKYVCRNITVEPLLAFFQVSSVLSSLTTQNLNLQKACRVNLRMDDDVCHGLENKNMSFYAHQEVQVQQLVADMLIWQTMIQSSIPCILVIFIGSWSDRNRKRKPCMLVPVIGEIVRNFGLLLCVFYFDELRMEVAGLVESIPTSMAGGLTVLYLAAFSYMGDISSMKNRTLRVGLMNLFFGVAWPVGAALSGVLYQKLGFFGVYYISTALYVIAFIYGSVNIKEHPGSLELKNPTQRSKSFMYLVVDFFNLKHIKEAFHATFKKGPRRRWTKIIMLMFTIVVIQGPSHGESGIAYFYTRVRFNWNELDYSLFSTFLFMTNIVGVGFSIGVLSHLLKLDDALIGVIACISKVLAGLVFAFAPSELYFYIGAVVDVMSGTTYIVMRSILSKIVPHAELGQVSAIMAVIETIVPVVYKPLYSAIYRATLTTFPGTFYVISSIMLTPAIFVYWWMYHINNQEDKKTCTVEEIKSNDNPAFENN